jgi:hypothetical protein
MNLAPDVEALIAELGRLWRNYSSAFQTGDMKAIMPMFDMPVSIVTREDTRVFHDPETLLTNNEALVGFYRGQGVVRVEAVITDVEPFHRHFAQVKIAYTLLDADNETVVTFATVYGLKHKGDRWLVHHIIGQDERDAWTAHVSAVRTH